MKDTYVKIMLFDLFLCMTFLAFFLGIASLANAGECKDGEYTFHLAFMGDQTKNGESGKFRMTVNDLMDREQITIEETWSMLPYLQEDVIHREPTVDDATYACFCSAVAELESRLEAERDSKIKKLLNLNPDPGTFYGLDQEWGTGSFHAVKISAKIPENMKPVTMGSVNGIRVISPWELMQRNQVSRSDAQSVHEVWQADEYETEATNWLGYHLRLEDFYGGDYYNRGDWVFVDGVEVME